MTLLPLHAVSFLFSNLCSPVWFFFFTVLGSLVFPKGSPADYSEVCLSSFFSSAFKEVVPFDSWNHSSAVCWCLCGAEMGKRPKSCGASLSICCGDASSSWDVLGIPGLAPRLGAVTMSLGRDRLVGGHSGQTGAEKLEKGTAADVSGASQILW